LDHFWFTPGIAGHLSVIHARRVTPWGHSREERIVQHRSFTLLTLAAAVLPAGIALSGCGAAPVGEEAEDFDGVESQPAGCPTIGPGCNLPPLPTGTINPLPPPPPCALAPANVTLPAPTGTATFSATSPNGDYGSSTCQHRWIVEFTSSDSAKRYTVPNASFSDLTVANDLGRAACERAAAEVKVLGFAGTWRELRNTRYHGVVTPTACVAVADVSQAALSLQGYSRIRTAVNRSWTFNGVTEYIPATGALTGL